MPRNQKNTQPEEPTKDDLMDQARELDVEGRSKMDKEELAEAVAEADSKSEAPAPAGNEEPTEQLLVTESATATPAAAVAATESAGSDKQDAEEAARQLIADKDAIASELGEEYVTRFTQGGSTVWTQES